MLAVAATALAAGVNGFSSVPAVRASTRFGVRQVSFESSNHHGVMANERN